LNKFCLIVPAFHYNRVSRCLKSLLSFDLGFDHDIFIIHNKFETNIQNRRSRSREEIDTISKMGIALDKRYSNIKYFERQNVGEDIGAYRAGYLEVLKSDYQYYFFIAEMAVSKRGGWLKEYNDMFQGNKSIGLICPHIGFGKKYTFVIKSSYFCIRKELVLDDWPRPLSRKDTEWQEMEYFYPAVKKRDFFAMHYGTGIDHLSYLNDKNKESHTKFLIPGKLLGDFLV